MAESDSADIFTEMLRMQSEAARQIVTASMPSEAALAEWGEAAQRLQSMWSDFHSQDKLPEPPTPVLADPAQWMGLMQAWYRQIPILDPERQQQLWQEGMALWQDILEQYGVGPNGEATAAPPKAEPDLPRKDRRFADPAWGAHPGFARIHHTNHLLAERQLTMNTVRPCSTAHFTKLFFGLRSRM
jgi:polyhydroxyalkanoate synthase